ncbi:FecR family protein [Azospirillum sp. ST 5-10]|uniref:FecR family protein n=1 Tax=unclassified Azospirillum TaxID=2630922 RepID=UPI003F4A5E3A
MSERSAESSDDRLSREAADWFMRLHAPECSDDERAAFRRWRAAAPEHAREYAAIEEIWAIADRIPARSAPPRRAMPPPPGGTLAARPAGRRREWRRMAAAAGLAALAIGLGWAGGWGVGLLPSRIAYYGRADTVRTVTLPDGSAVEVNLRTALLYADFRDRRSVRLSDGEAYFEVSHDRERPFAVHAGDGTVTVTGTRFDVWSDPQQLVVTLLEGAVTVEGGDGAARPLSPGMQARLRRGEAEPSVAAVDTDAAVAWRDGKLVLNDLPLERALPMINHYLDRPVRIGDARVAAMRIGGIYDIAQLGRLPDSLGKVLPVRTVRRDGETVLYSR